MQRLTKTVLCAALAVTSSSAIARDIIQIAGSSTVLPFSSIVAEEFAQQYSQYKTPVVGSGGTGGGLRQFCQGTGTNTIDIANASRPIKPAEIARCQEAGVQQIIPITIGYDGIVFASDANKPSFALTPEHIFKAAAAEVIHNGKRVANPYQQWSDIDSTLPKQAITLVIPASNHGTREVFEEKLLQTGCQSMPALIEQAGEESCTRLRQDGRIIETSGDYTETLARLQVQDDAVGVFGLGFYEQNRDKLQVATINGITPSLSTIADGTYPVSRPLFFYVKGEHLNRTPGLAEYVEFFLEDYVSGFGSVLEETGLIPLTDDSRAEILAAFKQRHTVTGE